MRPFVVEAGTPGCTVSKMEHKLGIRASDTVSIVLQDCRIPFDNILGSPEVVEKKKDEKGFKGAMATFDATRPLVAASALGIARATLELLKELLEERVKICQTVAQRKNIRLHAIYSELPEAMFDENRINQVVDNLISNAVKFSPPDTDIYISLEKEGETGKVSVRDQGPGISEEDQTKLFGEFQKLSARPTGDESSTGLGLSIVKKIIDAHKGNIWVESKLGEGSTFIFTLPLEG